MTALIIMLPLYYQVVLKWSADDAGLQLIALTGGMAVGQLSSQARPSARLGKARLFPICGGLGAARSLCLLIAREGLGRSTIFDALCTGGLGVAMGCVINPMLVIIQNGLEVKDIGVGVASMTFFRSLAGAFGVAIFSTFLVVGARRQGSSRAAGIGPSSATTRA